MSLFEVKIGSAVLPCDALGYYFKGGLSQDILSEGDTITITVQGGIADFTWEAVTPGLSLGNATTSTRSNTVTCDYFPTIPGKRATIKVTDSCGNEAFCYIALVDDIENGCISGSCASESDPVISGPTTDVQVGSQFSVTGGSGPYRWRALGFSMDSTGLIRGEAPVTSKTKDIDITVIDLCGKRDTYSVSRHVEPITSFNSWVAEVGEVVTYNFGCDDDPRWSINCGEIDRRTGEILSLEGCECMENITVSVDDSCGNNYEESKTNEDYVILELSGTDEPLVGSQYHASGGIAPYVYSFEGGSIDSSGIITSITSCGGPVNNGAVGFVRVTDACGQTAEIEVRLSGGHFIVISDESDPCADGGHVQTTCYVGRYRIITVWYNYYYTTGCTPVSPMCRDDSTPSEYQYPGNVQTFEWTCE